MYVRVVKFKLEPGARSTAENLADKIVPAIRAQNGCNKCLFLIDDEAGEYGFIVIWESKEDAGAAAAVIGPQLTAALSEITEMDDSRQLFEVYEPK